MDMVHELNGMFAMANLGRPGAGAVPDPRPLRDQASLLPARPRIFRFASEIKAILADPRVTRERLPPGHARLPDLRVRARPPDRLRRTSTSSLPPTGCGSMRDGDTTLRRYWDLPFGPDEGLDEERIVAGLPRSHGSRPSSAASSPTSPSASSSPEAWTPALSVALMHRHVSEPIRTYSVGFEEPSFDERNAARDGVEAFRHGTPGGRGHPGAWCGRLLPGYLRYIDEPYADGSAIPTWSSASCAKEDVVVLLSGEGGDEVFAGYDTYAAFKAAGVARRVPALVRKGLLAPLVDRLPVSHSKLSLEFRLKRFLGGLDLPPADAHLWWRIVLTDAQKRALYTPQVLEALRAEAPERHFREVFERSGATRCPQPPPPCGLGGLPPR